MGLYDIEKVKKILMENDKRIVDVREFENQDYIALPNGRSYYVCKCPYCNNKIRIQTWSFTTTGKKCSCGAVLRGLLAIKRS